MKLPRIFHNNEKIISNNKHSFSSFNNNEENKKNEDSFSRDLLVNYFNKMIVVSLKNGNKYSGILVSKRGNVILLNTGEYININEIVSIN
jgi:small nuclear ribonucleoprotein (snRNP)-like protein